jgi:hypothetical protein
MANEKSFIIRAEEVKAMIEANLSGIASGKITVDRQQVGYMYREEAIADHDSGWRFFSGKEDKEYADNEANFAFYPINTIANYDPEIIPYLALPIGTELARNAEGEFEQL